jgi:cytoskeletal protein RodZ
VRRYRAERSSPARPTVLIVVGLLVAVALIVVLVFSLGGGGSKGASSSSNATSSGSSTAATKSTTTKTKSSSKKSAAASATTSPAELSVTVLNGTTTTGLARHTSEELQQHGFTKAAPLNGQPPGANQTTTVQYTSGHSADAQSVAQALGVAQAQPIEGTVASMAPGASVVVIVGLDKASSTP